jgi:hypothetical protein
MHKKAKLTPSLHDEYRDPPEPPGILVRRPSGVERTVAFLRLEAHPTA